MNRFTKTCLAEHQSDWWIGKLYDYITRVDMDPMGNWIHFNPVDLHVGNYAWCGICGLRWEHDIGHILEAGGGVWRSRGLTRISKHFKG